MIYLRTADDNLYDTVRLQLDAAWGHPTPDGRTITCICPAEFAPRDAQGRIVLAVRDEFAVYEPAASLLPQLLASGAVQQIDEADYNAAGELR